jgi:Tol biopolymer transport system component
MSRHRIALLLMLFLITTCLIPRDVLAQYFGQNKVRYEDYDFKVLKTEHFDIYYYDEEAAAVMELGRLSERWYTRLSTVLDHQLSRRQPIVMYSSHPAFRGTTVIPDMIGETTGGVTEGMRNRMVMPFAGPLKETDHVLGHEMVHAFQFDITRHGDVPGAAGLPLWFVEGMAEYLSLGSADSQTAMWVRDAVRRNKLPDVEHLDDPDYFPYRFGQAFWAYVGGRYGDNVIAPMLRRAADSGDPADAIQRVLSIDAKTLSQEWHAALRSEYEPILRTTTPSSEYGTVVVQGRKSGGGEINVGPALSPDGSRMVFFSERDLFSIDLYLADARTGRIERRITKTALDPHVDSLQFVNSAGDWSRDGSRFAFGSIKNGRPELSVYDVERQRIEHDFSLPRLGEIYNVTWSPDGQSIAFSAMLGGVTDLFILDLKTENLRQLTSDAFADLQPAWSPDGTRIAFVTDRFSSDLATLSFGQYRLALLNPTTGGIEQVRGFEEGTHTDPQWSADNSSIYFVSDRNGIPNVYRLLRSSGTFYQITNLQTGVSGITRLSPALSVASNANGMVFSTFSEGFYSLRRIDGPAAVAGQLLSPGAPSVPAILPPRSSATGDVATLLRNPRQGLRSAQDFRSEKYSPRLSLDYIAPPSVEVGVSNFGSLIGGGTTFAWSDLLGRHNLTTTLQTSISTNGGSLLNNLAAIAGYQNERHRWTWGVSGGQVPFTSAEFSRTVTSVEGTPVLVDRSVQFWQINREILGYYAYPFSRAQRIEFSTGYRHISFDAQQDTEVFNLITGDRIGDDSQDIESPSPLNLGTGAAALVYDTSIFGGTSPVQGRRYRFEAGTTVGNLRYGSLLADFRQYYQIARPLSIAGRVLHYGRYGGDAEDSRLQELFLGQDSLVRGYSAGSFSASECGPSDSAGACPVFDRLVGSRIAVANAEIRLPIFGALGVVRSPNAPPVEASLFYDAGWAWVSGGPRRPVTSYGTSLRVNLLGFAIGQLSLAHPNHRPAKGWTWEFSLLPGF